VSSSLGEVRASEGRKLVALSTRVHAQSRNRIAVPCHFKNACRAVQGVQNCISRG
jgi:hypothetical protein